jgi:hypothetical protein
LVTYQLVVRPYLFDRITQVANTATALQVNLRSAVLVASSKLWPGFSNQGCWAYIALAPDVGDLLLSTPAVCYGYN